ncbi:MAG: hypothetical protein P1P76_01500 [Anaerolineales bacterium]|nr:hypothetical protein [Anaerolineales bacterium]
METTFNLPEDLLDHLPEPDPEPSIWVVGGAIRDHLLGRTYSDIDFVVDGDAISLARSVANALGWDFFILDGDRGAARILHRAVSSRIKRMDFSSLRGEGILEDLRFRDFTINALAIDPFNLSRLIDPTGGLKDLRSKRLRPCGPRSLHEDPVRVIRAVRFATDLGLKMEPETTAQVRDAAGEIEQVSIERTRDELFLILDSSQAHTSTRLLDQLGVLSAIFPRIPGANRSGSVEGRDHLQSGLDRVREFVKLTGILRPEHDPEAAADAILGSASLRLGRFRQQLHAYLHEQLSDERRRYGLIVFALLQHVQEDNSLHRGEFESHEGDCTRRVSGEHPAVEAARRFRLSRVECTFIGGIMQAFTRLEEIDGEDALTDLAVYRYYRVHGSAGVGAVLLYLGNLLAGSPGPPDASDWERRLLAARSLWEGYFERYGELVNPEPILDGSVLIEELGMKPGPEIGELLEALVEAQVTGEIHDRGGAIEFARRTLNQR